MLWPELQVSEHAEPDSSPENTDATITVPTTTI